MMEALSPRSVNIQVQRKPFNEKDFAVVEPPKPVERPKDKEHALPPPAWVFQPPLKPGLLAEKYQTGAFLGKGGFAICYEGELRGRRNGLGNCKFAMKIVKAKMTQEKITEKFRTELQIHAKMRHPNIVQFHRAFTFKENTYVILELCPNGSVMDMMKKRKSLTLPEVRRFTVQICGAIKYMHTRNVIHRDLKMGNLFLDKDMNIKLGDFGLAAILATKAEYKGVYNSSVARRTTVCGTPNYIAPEILKKSNNGHDHKVDIWAIGVIVYAMLTGCPPFQSSSQKEIYERVKNVTYEWPKDGKCINDIPDEAKDLVACLLKADAEERFEPDLIVGHPFFSMHGGNAIPFAVEPTCRTSKPSWLKADRPRGDVMHKSCTVISLSKLARQCGVGHLSGHDEPFEVVGGNINLSLYKECLEEEIAETYPQVPMPRDMVYTSQTALLGWPNEQEPKPITLTPEYLEKESRIAPQDLAVEDELSLDLAQISRRVPALSPNIPRLQPVQIPGARPVPAMSHAATLRAAHFSTVPSWRPTFQTRGVAQAEAAAVKAPPSYTRSLRSHHGLLNGQPARSATVRSASNQSNKIDSEAIPSLKPAPRASRARSASIPVTHSKTEAGPIFATNEAIRSVSDNKEKEPPRRVVQDRKKTSAPAQDRTVPAAKSQRASSGASTYSGSTLREPLAVRTRQSARTVGKGSLMSPDDVVECVSGTKPEEVLENLRKIQTEIDTSLKKIGSDLRQPNCRTILMKQQGIHSRPVIAKWVDYTNKYGVGYILNNGAVGCVFMADGTYPRTCIHVSGAESHLNRKKNPSYSERQQIVHKNGAPVEFLEFSEEGLKRIFAPTAEFQLKTRADGTAEKMSPGTTTYDFEKRRKLLVWEKFGKYMIQKLVQVDEEESRVEQNILPITRRRNQPHASSYFVRFFQRLGNVSIWGYGSGSFQFNFPDHTKIMISDNGTWLDFYHLPTKAAKSLQQGVQLDYEDLCTRSVISYPTSVMVQGAYKGTDFSDIIATNDFVAKLEFVRKVVAIWVQCGGLGCLGKDNKYLLWDGMADANGKLVWVSVGSQDEDVRYFQPAADE